MRQSVGRTRSLSFSSFFSFFAPSYLFTLLFFQRDYHLAGSYRKILALPTDLTWSRIPYTDPDVSLAQSDEDQILERDPPPTAEDNAETDNKFLALQIRLKIGTSSYATMALREVTKTETSAGFQSLLTAKSDDQKFRGSGGNGGPNEEQEEEEEMEIEIEAEDQPTVSEQVSADASPVPVEEATQG